MTTRPCAHLDGNLCLRCLGDRCFVCLGKGSVDYYDSPIPCEECHGTGKDKSKERIKP
jgi:hypothetical protein